MLDRRIGEGWRALIWSQKVAHKVDPKWQLGGILESYGRHLGSSGTTWDPSGSIWEVFEKQMNQ